MILGVLQARTGSTRLPNKVLLPLAGAPMLVRQCERVLRAASLDRLVIATSRDAADDPIQALCDEHAWDCFRGSLDDVLDRFYRAARSYEPDHVVRLTGDCPLMDPVRIDRIVGVHVADGNDYTSNAIERTDPDGLDVEVVRWRALVAAWKEATLPSEREHVLPFVHRRPERFRLGAVTSTPDLSALRWSVDEPEDLVLIRRIYEHLYPADPAFTTEDVLALLARHPTWQEGNAHIPINEGLRKSEAEDRRYLERGGKDPS